MEIDGYGFGDGNRRFKKGLKGRDQYLE